jgi:GNAT superfamily N-acetyltransferase
MLMRCIARRYQRLLGDNRGVPATLRRMRDTDEELARVDELLTLAYATSSRRRELELFQTSQPDGWYVIDQDGSPVAVAGCLLYGPFCWLGLVATHPDLRGRGLASRLSGHLVEWALSRGCRTVALDASIVGRPVYERLGFQAVGETAELLRDPEAPPWSGESAARGSIADLGEIAALDSEVFGGDRSVLLREVFADARGSWWVTRTADGRLSGYLLARDRLLGPGAAVDEQTAARLVRSALAEGQEQRVLVPDESAFLTTLLALGFVEQRRLVHMRFGELELPGERSRLIAQLSYASG